MTKVRLLTDGSWTEELKLLDYDNTFTAVPYLSIADGTVLGYDVDAPELRKAGAIIDSNLPDLYFSISSCGTECEVVDG
ncbi:MAG: hypothetical protein V3T88_05535 [Nitrosomonadaceae bacterium]